jgi:tRNA (guanine37-N1)-methyltransferase
LKPYNVSFLTLYPEVFPGYLGFALAKKALEKKIWQYQCFNIRDFAKDKHKKVDDKVFGGGSGLLLKPDVLGDCIDYSMDKGASNYLVYPSPAGCVLNAKMAEDLSKQDGITFICGHFEGVDDRILKKYKPIEISIGDYILSGGELSAMVILDSILRFLPNVLNSMECIKEESFNNNLLEYPQYTKPLMYGDIGVPEVLLSGNHQAIKRWKLQQAEEKTKKIRPDLWQKYKDNS